MENNDVKQHLKNYKLRKNCKIMDTYLAINLYLIQKSNTLLYTYYLNCHLTLSRYFQTIKHILLTQYCLSADKKN